LSRRGGTGGLEIADAPGHASAFAGNVSGFGQNVHQRARTLDDRCAATSVKFIERDAQASGNGLTAALSRPGNNAGIRVSFAASDPDEKSAPR
jgi:hypothetical protein